MGAAAFRVFFDVVSAYRDFAERGGANKKHTKLLSNLTLTVHTLVHGAYAGAYPELLVVTGSGQSIHGGIDFPVCSQSFATQWARELS